MKNKIKLHSREIRELLRAPSEAMIEEWARDLVIVKTYTGLKFQEGLVKKVATLFKATDRLATPEVEEKRIDGCIVEAPVSIKPDTYEAKKSVEEKLMRPLFLIRS